MANAYASTKSPNTVFGLGSSPTLTYTYVFYSSLSEASEGIGGAAARRRFRREIRVSQDHSADLVDDSSGNIFGQCFNQHVCVGAEAVAGFAGTSVCSVAPIFVCNPYEDGLGVDDRCAGDVGSERRVQ